MIIMVAKVWRQDFQKFVSKIELFQVSSKGYLSMGRITAYSEIGNIPTHDISIVAPFAANTDLSDTGSVRVKTFFSHDVETTFLSAYISSRLEVSFSGTWMLVVDWYNVPQYLGPTVSQIQINFTSNYKTLAKTIIVKIFGLYRWQML